jgi:hypothetical protein
MIKVWIKKTIDRKKNIVGNYYNTKWIVFFFFFYIVFSLFFSYILHCIASHIYNSKYDFIVYQILILQN